LKNGYPIANKLARGEAGMKIVARIEKLAGVQFRFDGRVFDSFLDARREMATRAKLRRDERAARASGRVMTLQVSSASR